MSNYTIVEKTLDVLFGAGLPAAPIKVREYAPGSEELAWIPPVDPHYYFRADILRAVLNFFLDAQNGDQPDGLHLIGPTGSGKSSVVAQVAARLGMPMVEVTGHGRLEVQQLLYSKSAVNGTLYTTDGPLTMAMRNGWPFLFNEMDLVDPSTSTGLNDPLEYGRVVIEDSGELVRAKAGFCFIATSNSAGAGDETGSYAGVQVQNIALRDRLMKLEVDYPPRDAEVDLVNRVTGLEKDMAESFVDVASQVRTAFLDPATGLTATISTRGLLRWVRNSQKYKALASQSKGAINPLYYGLDLAVCNGLTRPEKVAIDEMVKTVFGVSRPV